MTACDVVLRKGNQLKVQYDVILSLNFSTFTQKNYFVVYLYYE